MCLPLPLGLRIVSSQGDDPSRHRISVWQKNIYVENHGDLALTLATGDQLMEHKNATIPAKSQGTYPAT